MSAPFAPTPFADVNAALADLLARIRALLGSRLRGVYLVGSLALGDFDPRGSDIDLIVVTDTELADDLFGGLRSLHAQFGAGGSAWAERIEAVYIPRAALGRGAPDTAHYPQLERGAPLFKAPLESGWPFQRFTLRERGVVVAGPDPRTLADPVRPQEMRSAAAAIAGLWAQQARSDPAWLEWLRQRDSQAFVVLTLCRMLYSLATGSVASKPQAAAWAARELGEPWAALIGRSLAGQHETGEPAQQDIDETVALVQLTLERSTSA